MKVCSKCIIPETAESHSYSNDNLCSVCSDLSTFKSNIDWKERSNQLDKLIEKNKNNNQYDCICPFSGGKDSTFALWYLVKIKKLKPLVVRFDHNYLRKTVEKNTEKVLKKLGVDFINFKPDFSIVKKIMLESLIRRGDFCWHCHVGIAAFPIKIAIEKKIPLIFYGEPSSEYSSFYSYEELEELNVEKFNRAINLGINAEDIVGMINEREKNTDSKVSLNDLQPYIFPSQRELYENKIKACYLGNYISWDVKKQVEIIKRELDWEGDEVEGVPEQYNYEKIECYMQGVRDYIRYIKRGFGRTAHLTSIDIRNDRISREEALKLTEKYDGKKPKALELFLKILNLKEDDFYDIVFKHVVDPHVPPSKEKLKVNSSNKFPKDFAEFEEKF